MQVRQKSDGDIQEMPIDASTGLSANLLVLLSSCSFPSRCMNPGSVYVEKSLNTRTNQRRRSDATIGTSCRVATTARPSC